MSPLNPNPGSYIVSRVLEYILCQGRVSFFARQLKGLWITQASLSVQQTGQMHFRCTR